MPADYVHINNYINNHTCKSSHLLLSIALVSFHCFSCPHCDNIKHHFYEVKNALNETGTNTNLLRASLDQGNLLIMCSCSECEIPREVTQLLESSHIPDGWNILQLQHTSNGSSNGRVKVIDYTEWDNGRTVREVLEWLDTKLHNS